MKRIAPILILATIGYSIGLFSQAPKLPFIHLDSKSGLSQSFVHCLAADQLGQVWAGTQDGLNRFDGYQFQPFYKEQGNPNSLSNNYIWTLYEDRKANIWIGTNGGGLCRYDPLKDQFATFYPEMSSSKAAGQNQVRSIIETQLGHLLVGTETGVYHFDTQNTTFKKLSLAASDTDFNKTIYAFTRLHDQTILMGSLETLLIYDEQKQQLRRAHFPLLIEGGIHCFSRSQEDRFWAGTGKGLYHLQWIPETDSLTILQHFEAKAGQTSAISSNYISSLLLDQEDQLWIGTNKGLNSFDPERPGAGFSAYQFDADQQHSISSDLIFDLLEVEPGIIWVATQQGINQFNAKAAVFQTFPLQDQGAGVCGTSVHGMVEDPDGYLLACTQKGLVRIAGTNLFSSTARLTCFNQKTFPQMEDEFLVNIREGQSGWYWVAMRRGGFAQLIKKEGQFEWKPYKLPAGAYSNIGTNDFIEEPDGTLWIASSGLGLWKYEPKQKTYLSFVKSDQDSLSLSGNYIFSLKEGSSQQLWVCTADGGLCQMDRQQSTFSCYTNNPLDEQSISSNMVLSVFEDSKNRTWVCTADGLNLLTEEGKFIRFYKRDGLPNNVIYGMLEDEQNQLWVSTDQGLAKIEYQQGLFSSQIYHQEHGLLNNELNQHAFQRLQSGQLIFGSKDGFSFFDPAQLSDYLVAPRVMLTDFKLFNESVAVGLGNDDAFRLEKAISFTDNIRLPHDQDFIAFEFSGINFEQASANRYAYQLKGLDQDWVYCGERRYANYPALQPGQYEFVVKAANHDGIWSEPTPALQLIIDRPIWLRWWAYLLYGLAFFSMIYGWFRYRLYTAQKIEQTKQQERQRFRKRSAQDFHDEAGNQITKISLMTEVAKRKTNDSSELGDLLAQIGEDIQQLRSGMRDFIWVLDPDNDNLYETVLRLKAFANEFFEYSSINFTTAGMDESLQTLILNSNQRRHLLLIFKEAINNTLKYSTAQQARLELIRHPGEIEFIFSDDGIGYRPESAEGNGLSNMESRSQKIGARYLNESKTGQGSRIRVFLPITHMGD